MSYQQEIKFASNGEKAIATSLGNLCTGDQVRKIRALSAALEVDANKISLSLFNLKYDELSRSGAEDVIRHLETLLGENKKGGEVYDLQEFIKVKGKKSPA